MHGELNQKKICLNAFDAEHKIPRNELKTVKNQRLISSKTIIWRPNLNKSKISREILEAP